MDLERQRPGQFGELRLVFASRPDREWLIAEIWHGEQYLAEINQEGEELEVQVYPREDGQPWHLALKDLIGALKAIDAQLARGGDREQPGRPRP